MPLLYIVGFVLIPRQLAAERELPPPYSPRNGPVEPVGVRRLLGLEETEGNDDGSHDVFSERSTSQSRTGSGGTSTSEDIEMSQVATERWTPVSLATSR